MEEGERRQMREGARERGSGREEQTAERESVGGKMLTLLLHLGKKADRGEQGGENKKAKTEGTWEREKEGAGAREHV